MKKNLLFIFLSISIVFIACEISNSSISETGIQQKPKTDTEAPEEPPKDNPETNPTETTTKALIRIEYNNISKEFSTYVDIQNFLVYEIPKSSIPIIITILEENPVVSRIRTIVNYLFLSENTCILDLSACIKLFSIDDNAFSNEKNIKKIILPQTLTKLGDNCFSGCTELETIILPKEVTKLPKGTFSGCTNLLFQIPDTIEEIGDGCFSDCKQFTDVILPKSLETLGDYVFSNCNNLKKVKLGNNIKRIPKYCFSNCKKLTEIDFGQNIELLDDNAFEFCTSLTKILNLPFSLKSIGNYCFSDCEQLTDVYLPDGLEEINNGAFWNCISLKNICLPDTLKRLEGNIFGLFREVDNIGTLQITMSSKILEYNNIYTIRFEHMERLSWFNSCWRNLNIIFSDGSKTICDGALMGFYSDYNLHVTIPETVEDIGLFAFAATSLDSLVIPKSVKKICKNAFPQASKTSYIKFEDISNWYVTNNSDYTGGEPIDLSDAKKNIELLSDTYLNYYFYKKD